MARLELNELYLQLSKAIELTNLESASTQHKLKSTKQSKTISKPPATDIATALRFIFSKKVMAEVFEQVIADGRHEYFEALNNNERYRARWRATAIYLNLLCAFTSWCFSKLCKQVTKFWKIG